MSKAMFGDSMIFSGFAKMTAANKSRMNKVGRADHSLASQTQQHEVQQVMKLKKFVRLAVTSVIVLVLIVALALAILWWYLAPSETAPASPVVPAGPVSSVEREIETGSLAGVRDGDILIFKGIPYASPPVGHLRWRPPAPPESWSGRRDASQFGNDCWQVKAPSDPARSSQPMSEDCLTINVWAPAEIPEGGAPVMFWIHGGGFVQGSSSQPALDGSEFARRGIVLVSFNYRLGRFGFFAHPALMAEAGSEPAGNWGLMDQVAALRWVSRNISTFGGDPGRITLFGQSAGGASVAQLMLDPQVNGLYSRAIIQSSGGRNRWVPMRSANPDGHSGLRAAEGFAANAGLDEPDAGELRSLNAELLVGNLSLAKLDPKTFSGPIIDGKLVRSDFVDGFLAGRQAGVPLIVGSTNRELSHLNFLARWGLRQWAKRELGHSLKAVRASYASQDAFDDNIVNDWGFAEPARTLAASHASRGYNTWLYSFDYIGSARREVYDGAPHASDVTFVFGNLGREGIVPDDRDWKMSSAIQAYWRTFATSGNPDASAYPAWPRYESGAGQLLRFEQSGPRLDGVARQSELDAISQAMALGSNR